MGRRLALAFLVFLNSCAFVAASDARWPFEGTWLSNWGPVTLTAEQQTGGLRVGGMMQQWPGQKGKIIEGHYNSDARKLDFVYRQEWDERITTVSVTFAPNGQTMKGVWRSSGASGGGQGAYTAQFLFRGPPPHVRDARPRGMALPSAARVEVLPVLFIARDATWVTTSDIDLFAWLLSRHVEQAQRYYKSQLVTDTFKIADEPVFVHRGKLDDADYLAALKPNHRGPGEADITRELLKARGEDRYSTNKIFLTVYIRSKPRAEGGGFHGGGRTFNGAPNTGGGSVELELEWMLNISSGFQQAVNHELGHAFGLLHPDAYGYDQKNNASIMSYDPKIATTGFEMAKGLFNPEEFFALGANKRAFPDFRYTPSQHNPNGKTFRMKTLPCVPDYVSQRRGFKPNSCMTWPCPCG